MVVCADSERALAVQRTCVCGGVSAAHLVPWSCGHACGFVVARRFFRAPRKPVANQQTLVAMALRSLGAWAMARSALWPSVDLAGLICNWISMAPSNVAIVIGRGI